MSKFIKKWRREIFLGSLIIILAILLRVINLTALPIFGDEAIYIRWAQIMRSEPTLRFVPLTDGKQPLFMWSVIPFLKLFSDPLIAGRVVSVFTGIGTLIGVFILSFLLFKSEKVCLTAGLIYAISPFSVFFDRLALVDSMLAFFGVWILIFSVITVKKQRLDTAMITGFTLGGALLTKSPALFFALLIPLVLILVKWPFNFRKSFNNMSVYVFLFTFTYLIGYGMYNILRLGPNFQMIKVRNKDYVFSYSHIFTKPLDPLLPFLDRVKQYFWIMGPGLLFILLVLGLYYGIKKFKKETILLAGWSLIPIFAVSEYSKVMTARYVYFTVPFVFVIAAVSFHWLSSLNRVLKNSLKIIFSLYIFTALYFDFLLITNPREAPLPRSERSGFLEEWTSGYGISEVADYLRNEQQQNPDEKIVVGTEGYFGTLPDGLQIYLNDMPEITVIGVGQTYDTLPSSLLESKASGNNTFLVINSSRFSGNAGKMGLELIHSYPKATRPDSSREELLFFEVIDVISQR